MSATIMHNPELIFVTDPGGTPADVDVSCYTVAVELSADSETIDIGTFCEPNASEVGRTTEECVVAFLWEPDLYTALQPLIGQEIQVELRPDGTADPNAISFLGRFSAVPWGRFELGQRVEVDLQVAVLSSITYGVLA